MPKSKKPRKGKAGAAGAAPRTPKKTVTPKQSAMPAKFEQGNITGNLPPPRMPGKGGSR